MGTAVDEDLAPAPDAAVTPPAEDHDLDFLKPSWRRPALAPAGEELAPAPDAEVVAPPEDRIGRANRDYQANVAALASGPGGPAQPSAPLPQTSGPEALGRGAIQGASLGWGDEIAAAADSLISKVPGVRNVAEHLADTAGGRGASLDYTNPNLTYAERRDAYRRLNDAAQQQHGKLYGTGEIAGGIASTALLPEAKVAEETAAARAALAEELAATRGGRLAATAGQAALLGTAAGAGGSSAATPGGVATDALESGGAGAVGGALLHPLATKVVAPLAQRALAKLGSKAAAVADRQAVQQLVKDAPQSLTNPLTQDANLSAAINEPIQVAPKKTVTLRDIAGRSAEEVRPVVQAKQAEVDKAIGGLLDKSGEADLSDLAGHYDKQAAQYAKTPGNTKFIHSIEDARQEALEHWGPSEEARQARLDEIGGERDKLYEGSDKASGGATLGDLVKHYDDHIAQLSKMPGNEPYVDALTRARDSAVKAWGTRPIFDAESAVADGPFAGGKAGDAVTKLETMAKSRPAQAADLTAEADRIRTAATKDGFDPTVKVPAKDVRKYATTLQNEAQTSATDPKLAAKARQFIGTATKDFVNQHVGNTLGAADRKALEALNSRTTNILNWPDIVSGKNVDPKLRDAVLKEFDQKIAPREMDEYASKLEQRGTQRIDKLTPGEISDAKENLAKTTRDFANQHASRNLSAADQAEYERQQSLRASLKNIDTVLERRKGKENANKIGLRDVLAHTAGAGVGMSEIAHGVGKALTGDIGGAAAHIGGGVAAAALPFAAKHAAAVGRAAVRGVANGADLLANVAAAADAGNPWARRQIDLLRQTPAGAARLAAALARMKGAGGGTTGAGGNP